MKLRLPGHPIRTCSGRDLLGDLPALEVNDGHVVVAINRDIGHRRLRSWRYQNTFGRAAERHTPDHFARGRVDDGQLAGVDVRDERELAVGRQADPIGPLGTGFDRLPDLACGNVDQRDPAILRVRAPDGLAVR